VIANYEDRFPEFSDDEVWKRDIANRDFNRVATPSTMHILFARLYRALNESLNMSPGEYVCNETLKTYVRYLNDGGVCHYKLITRVNLTNLGFIWPLLLH